jgi:hypothetical protein
MQGPEVRRVCVESLDIRVGDSFDKVAEIISLRPDPNGANQNMRWVAGKYTDFLSTAGPEYSFDDGSGVLRSTVYCTFDDRRRLRSLTLSWTYDREQTTKARDAVLNALQNKIHKCLNKRIIEVSRGKYVARIDYGTYSQEFVFDSTGSDKWQIHYTISEEP